MLQAAAHFVYGFRAQQVGEVNALQQVLQQVAIGGQRLQLAFGLGRIPFVHIDRDQVPQQALRHRRGGDRLECHHFDLAAGDASEHFLQVGQVHHFLEAVAVGFGDDGEIFKAAHDLQQVTGAQPLQPEGRALAAPQPRQQQRPPGVLTKLRAKDRRVGQFTKHTLAHFGGRQRRHQVEWKVGVSGREAEEDAVVVALHFDLDARALAQGPGQGDAPQPVDAPAKGRMNHQARVAQGVVKDLDQQRAVGRDGPGVIDLARHVVEHDPGRIGVERVVMAQPGQ